MMFKVLLLCVAVVAVQAGYLQPDLRYVVPASIGIAAPAIARIEHLSPASASLHRTETYTAPIARTSLIAPAVQHTIAATPLIESAHIPVIRTGYLGHSFGYGGAPLGFGYAGTYRAGW